MKLRLLTATFLLASLTVSASANAPVRSIGFVVGPYEDPAWPHVSYQDKVPPTRVPGGEVLTWAFTDSNNYDQPKRFLVSKLSLTFFSKNKKAKLLVRGAKGLINEQAQDLRGLYQFSSVKQTGNYNGLVMLSSQQSTEVAFNPPIQVDSMKFYYEAFYDADATILVRADFPEMENSEQLSSTFSRLYINPPGQQGSSANSGSSGVSECAGRELDYIQRLSLCNQIRNPQDRDTCLSALGADPGGCQ